MELREREEEKVEIKELKHGIRCYFTWIPVFKLHDSQCSDYCPLYCGVGYMIWGWHIFPFPFS